MQGGEHTLVNNIAVGKGYYIEIFFVFDIRLQNSGFNLFTQDVKLAAQFHLIDFTGRGDEYLLDGRFCCGRTFTENVTVDRDIASRQKLQSRVEYFTFEQVEKSSLRVFIFGQKNETRSITAFFWNRNTLQKNKLVRYLHHNTGTVAGIGIGTLGSTVVHVLEHLQSIFHDLMRFAPVDIYQQTYATGIVFVGRTIQSLFFGFSTVLHSLKSMYYFKKPAGPTGQMPSNPVGRYQVCYTH